MDGGLAFSDITTRLDAAVRGLGIALLPMLLVGDLLTQGTLVHILPDVIHAEQRVVVVYRERKLIPPHVKAFVDALTAWARRVVRTAAGRAHRLVDASSQVPGRARKH